jgi:hypothetical protein
VIDVRVVYDSSLYEHDELTDIANSIQDLLLNRFKNTEVELSDMGFMFDFCPSNTPSTRPGDIVVVIDFPLEARRAVTPYPIVGAQMAKVIAGAVSPGWYPSVMVELKLSDKGSGSYHGPVED